MGLLIKKPSTPSLRKTVLLNSGVKKNPVRLKTLIVKKKKSTGKNITGRYTVYTKGGGHKRLYRIIEFDKKNIIEGVIVSIEYDPNRTSNIIKIYTSEKKFKFLIAATSLKVGNYIKDYSNISKSLNFHVGCLYQLQQLSIGSYIFNINFPGSSNTFVRSAGCAAKILTISLKTCRVKLPSGEIRLLKPEDKVFLGRVSNIDHRFQVLGKAGRNRWLNRRPIVRGVAMNPVDHPHGGGEGKTSGGRPSVTAWGKVAKGKPTRKKNKYTKNFILKI